MNSKNLSVNKHTLEKVAARQDVLDIIMQDSSTLTRRTNDVIQAALTDEMTDLIKLQDHNGTWHEWRVSKGSTHDEKRGVELRLARAIDGRTTDRHPVVIQDKNPNVVVARFYDGLLINTDDGVTPLAEEGQLHTVLDLVTDVLKNAGNVVENELRTKTNKRQARHHTAARFVRGVAIAGVLAAGVPYGIDQADQFLDSRHAEQQADDAAKAADEATRKAETEKAAEQYQKDILSFDTAYPILLHPTTLTNEALSAVTSTEQFDRIATEGLFVPTYTTASSAEADLSHIRSVELPAEGECTSTEIALPEASLLNAVHTASPDLLVTATPSAADNTLQVCVINTDTLDPNYIAPEAENTDTATSAGKLYLQFDS
jgi:hypothetical protein